MLTTKNFFRTFLTFALFCLSSAFALSEEQKQSPRTFTNPVLWADVPDPDVIRVGEYFYMVSTTMHLMPGAPVMRSRDLVHWEVVSYLYDTLHETPKYDMQEGTVYGRGQWATSLRYHDGMFYALFSPNDVPYRSFIYKTTDPARGWQLHSRMKHFHDSSLFFDDDGRVYVFSGTGSLEELEPDLSGVKEGGVKMQLFKRDSTETGLLEGSRVIKHEGKYYLLMISWPRGEKRRQVCYRADHITGPYEKKVILTDNFAGFPYVGQGCIVDAPDGKWYGVIFQDRGAVGRVLTLMPCRWIDGWPMLGDESGRVPHEMLCPGQDTELNAQHAEQSIVVSDDFSAPELSLHWQWNHNPIPEAWSLTERKGYLRLRTSRIVPHLYLAPNTLTQRMEGPRCSGTVLMDLKGMKDGDRAGLAAFNGHSGILTVSREGKERFLTYSTAVVDLTDREKAVTATNEEVIERIPIKGRRLALRVEADFRLGQDWATFSYSLDRKTWHPIGKPFKMMFDYRRLFMGTKFAIFNFATSQTGGYVDVDAFLYSKDKE